MLTGADVLEMQQAVTQVRVDDSLVGYVLAIVRATRESEQFSLGVSPRGSQMLYRAGQAMAFLDGRNFCVPEDFKPLVVAVFAHRVAVNGRYSSTLKKSEQAEQLIREWWRPYGCRFRPAAPAGIENQLLVSEFPVLSLAFSLRVIIVSCHVIVSSFSYAARSDRLAGRSDIFSGGGSDCLLGAADAAAGGLGGGPFAGDFALDGNDLRRGVSGQFPAGSAA